jgi:hypothetical protein
LIDALVVEVSTRLFLQPKEESRLQLTNIVTTNQEKIVGGAKRILGCAFIEIYEFLRKNGASACKVNDFCAPV